MKANEFPKEVRVPNGGLAMDFIASRLLEVGSGAAMDDLGSLATFASDLLSERDQLKADLEKSAAQLKRMCAERDELVAALKDIAGWVEDYATALANEHDGIEGEMPVSYAVAGCVESRRQARALIARIEKASGSPVKQEGEKP